MVIFDALSHDATTIFNSIIDVKPTSSMIICIDL